MSQNKPKKKNSLWTRGKVSGIIVIVLIIFATWLFLPYWIYKFTGLTNTEGDVGKLGDMYGLLKYFVYRAQHCSIDHNHINTAKGDSR